MDFGQMKKNEMKNDTQFQEKKIPVEIEDWINESTIRMQH